MNDRDVALAVQQRIHRILEAGGSQSSQLRQELTDLEAENQKLAFALKVAHENRDNLAADYRAYRVRAERTIELLREQLKASRGELVIDGSGPSWKSLNEDKEAGDE